MRYIFGILVFLLYVAAAPANEPPSVDAATDALVSLLVDTDAKEHRKARKIHYATNNAGLVFVFFTIEGFNGGNNYTFYLAVFKPDRVFDPSRGEAQQRRPDNIAKYSLVGYAPVGGKGWRSVDFSTFTIEKQKLILETKEYASNDPLCCPSKVGTAVYKIDDKQITEVKPN